MIKTEQLYYLTQIAKYNSINKVAEKLYMSSAAISTAIKQLEKECGYEILERTYRGVKLTEKGKTVVKLAEQMLSLQEEILNMGKEKEVLLNKHKLCTDARTLKLLSNKIIGPGAKVLDYFEIKEADHIDENYYEQLAEDTVVMMILSYENREILENDPRIQIRYLYASKLYPVSSKNTKYIKNNRNYVSKEEFRVLPKIKMRTSYDSITDNIVLSTDDSWIYSEAIKNDYGVGVIAKFAPDIYAIDYEEVKIYEPFDEEIYVVMLTREDCDKTIVELLEALIKQH